MKKEIEYKKIVYVDMDGVIADFYKSHKEKQTPDMKYPQAEYGFFLNLEEIPNAIYNMKLLEDIYDVYILTAPSEINPLCYTEKRLWIEQHLGSEWINKLIISPHKHLNIGDYFIDDKTSGKGQDIFDGELIHFGSDKYPNWGSVVKYLLEKQ